MSVFQKDQWQNIKFVLVLLSCHRSGFCYIMVKKYSLIFLIFCSANSFFVWDFLWLIAFVKIRSLFFKNNIFLGYFSCKVQHKEIYIICTFLLVGKSMLSMNFIELKSGKLSLYIRNLHYITGGVLGWWTSSAKCIECFFDAAQEQSKQFRVYWWSYDGLVFNLDPKHV